jgi:septal ring factor EnvC (AmiA/AmiB activator)
MKEPIDADPVGLTGTEGLRATEEFELLQSQLRAAEETLREATADVVRFAAERDEARATLAQAIDKNLDWLKKASFIIERNGFLAVVDHSDAMHALLFVRQTLAAVPGTPEGQ